MNQMLKKITALLLAVTMLLSMAACGKTAQPAETEPQMEVPYRQEEFVPVQSEPQTEPQTEPAAEETAAPTEEPPAETEGTKVVQTGSGNKNKDNKNNNNKNNKQDNVQPPKVEEDRESLEEIADLIKDVVPGAGSSLTDEVVSKLDDVSLSELITNLLENTGKVPAGDPAPDVTPDEDAPDMDVGEKEEHYDENGAMEIPFDQMYPDAVVQEQVQFDKETLLIKMYNSYGGAISAGMKAAGVAALEPIVPMETATWYEAKLLMGTNIVEAVEALRALGEILMVDYNYQVETAAMAQYEALPEGWADNTQVTEQWYLNYCGIPSGTGELSVPGGSSSVVVAVIDTGVDYNHEDLADNIWVNTGETPDNGVDDDGNGYIDDYYGVDIVAGKGSGNDDHGHGTHVAGIIAAKNNNLGVVGIAHNVKIMPVKAAMASGYLNQSDIAKAILYAYEHGAEVINMSFGGSACSIAVQDALEVAYTRCVLVASAGNDGMPDEKRIPSLPNYPAALSYVLGVMSVNQSGVESGFSNWDAELYSPYEYELYAPGEAILSTIPGNRYASWSGTSMAAPVVAAMAALLRSEYSDRNTYPTKFIYGQLVATSENYGICCNPIDHGPHNLPPIANLYQAVTVMPKPDVGLQDYALFDTEGMAQDTAGVNSGEGVIDAGETIALGLTLRNRWGMSKDTIVKIDTLSDGGVADPYITIHNPEVNYGSVGTYSTGNCGAIYTDGLLTAWENPFYITISEDCPNDYIFTLNVTVTCSNALDEEDTATYQSRSTISLEVRNGTVLPNIIEEDMVLTSDNLYIIPNATVIQAGVTVTVEPGTHIQFWSNEADDPYADKYVAYLRVDGNLFLKGTPEENIYLFPSDLMSNYPVELGANGNGVVTMEYVDATNMYSGYGNVGGGIAWADHCVFRINYGAGLRYRYVSGGNVLDYGKGSTTYYWLPSFGLATDCVFYKIGSYETKPWHIYGQFDRCLFVDCGLMMGDNQYNTNRFTNCVMLGNSYTDQTAGGTATASTLTLQDSKLVWPDVQFAYRAETGTTYFTASTELPETFLEELNAHPAIIEDQEELDWLNWLGEGKIIDTCYAMSNSPSANRYYRFGMIFDQEQKRITWSDGSAIGEFLDPDGLAVNAEYPLNIVLSDYQKYNEFKLMIPTMNASYGIWVYEMEGEILPTEITLVDYDVQLDMEMTYPLHPVTAPVQVPNEMLVYESSDETVLTVNEQGVITPVGLGDADVYIRSRDGAVSNYVTVHVKEAVALESIVLDKATVDLPIGQTYTPGVYLFPQNTTKAGTLTYRSSDDSVAAVDGNGKITAVSSGEAVITVEGQGITAELTVTVYRETTSMRFAKGVVVYEISEEPQALPELVLSEGAEPALLWKSADNAVAEVMDNGTLLVKSEGVSTLFAIDRRTGLYAEMILVSTQEKLPAIRKITNQGEYSWALMGDGKLYYWVEGNTPVLKYEDVILFDGSRDNCIYQTSDGSVFIYWFAAGGLKDIDCTNMRDLAICSSSVGMTTRYYAVMSNGYCYAWNNNVDNPNSNGQHGLGHRNSVTTPTLVMLENVVQVEATNYTTWFLTEDGSLYFSGGSGSDAPTVPTLLTDGVELLINEGKSNVNFRKTDGCWYEPTNSNTSITTIGIPAGVELATDRNVYVDDGVVYYKSEAISGKMDITAFSGTFNQEHYVGTADGLIFGFGGSYGSSLNMINFQNAGINPLVLEATNLDVENVLLENTLRLDFNHKLLSAAPLLYGDGSQLVISTNLRQDYLEVSITGGFKSGVEYTLSIPAGQISAAGAMAEDLTLTFTYGGFEEPGTGDGSGTGDESAPEEEVIRESVLDETIVRHYTLETMTEKINELQEKYQYNNYFYGNVILNRISTETDPTRWLRIQAGIPYSDYGESALGGNYWGTVSETGIGLQIVDYNDFINYKRILYAPYLTTPPENVFPFVTDISIFNAYGEKVTTVSNEEITVRVSFNRDMDPSIPLVVRFGSAYPYGDYELEGTYVTPRVWEGKYTLTTLIENGNQYFTIMDGRSAQDDLDFYTDRARFTFVLDTTAAQALIMQGVATDTGIALTWTQDDFDTLMGYNVYRSTSEDGYYQRLNSTVIPAETMEFFDDTVEPGVVYYYNFTVVQTDLSESIPSGKISIMSKDTMAPDLYHSPVYNAFTGTNLVISATVTDNLSVTNASLYFRTVGETQWKTAIMNKLNDKYSAIIPAAQITTAGLEYYIEATDGINVTRKGSAEEPYVITVQEAVDASSRGDVNGDGKISNLDALMLLQAINDLLNLTAEQFARADLNGDGELTAAEALRILHYVSGKVGDLNMP